MCVKGSVLPFLACLNVDFVLTDRTELSLGPTNRPQHSQTYIIQCINIVVVTCNHLPDAGYCTCCCFSALTCSRRSLVDTAQIKMGLSERACVLVHLWRLIGFCNIPEIVNGDHSFLTFNNGFFKLLFFGNSFWGILAKKNVWNVFIFRVLVVFSLIYQKRQQS